MQDIIVFSQPNAGHSLVQNRNMGPAKSIRNKSDETSLVKLQVP